MNQTKISPLQQVKEKLDFMEIMREHINLEPSGDRLLGFCPFHENVNTPSFTVYPDQERWICYGCDKRGDVLTFLENIEGVSLRDILKKYAKEFGIPLFKLTREAKRHLVYQERLYEILALAAREFMAALTWYPSGQQALFYLEEERGILPKTIAQFNLGFAKDSWKDLVYYLKKEGYDEKLIIGAGLGRKNSSGNLYNFFRNRIIFPLAMNGETLGFVGRTMNEDPTKYLNSPSTDVFTKRKTLYGLSHAREGIKKAGSVVIVEGNMDVLALHQSGFDNTVSIMGTTLSKHQAKILSRLTNKIILALDPDDAGKKAIMRIKMENQAGIDIYIAELPGKDPDEIVLENKDDWSRIIDSAKAIPVYITDVLVAQSKNLNDPKEKKRIVNRIVYLLKFVSDPHEQAAYQEYLAKAVGYKSYNINTSCPHCGKKYHD